MNTTFRKCGFRTWNLFNRSQHQIPRFASRYFGTPCFILRPTIVNPKCLFSNWEIAIFSSGAKLNLTYQSGRLLTTSKNRCWKCNAIITERDLVCLSCGCVQEPRLNLNNFELFKENPQFDIDVRNLTVKFRRLQTLLHPDKFATRSEKEQQYSADQSSRVNKAYQTLYHPMERGLYLLELHGKPLLEGEIDVPSDFLADIMEINEMLDQCITADCVESIRHVNDAKLQMLFGDLALTFKEKNIDRARELIVKLKYYVNIDVQIKKVEEQLGISRDD